jgi:quercetin dioxygenase-like cupin family protein
MSVQQDQAVRMDQAIQIVRALALRAVAAPGDDDVHRKGPAPPSYELQERTGGRARAIAANLPLAETPQFKAPPGTETGWHYHNCDLQLAFIVRGDVDIAYADKQWRRCRAGEVLVIPGGAPHNAGRLSEDYGLIELTLPGAFGTTECAPHPTDAPRHAFVLTPDMVGDEAEDGRCALPDGTSQGADVCVLRAGAADFKIAPGRLALTLVIEGRCDIDTPDGRDQMGPFDMLVDQSLKGATSIGNRSADFKAYHIQLRA